MERKSIFRIIGLIILTTLLAISCDDLFKENNPFVGTWVSTEGYTVTFQDSSWYLPRYSRGEGLKGTYSYSGNTASITYTEISTNGGDWRPITASEASTYTRAA